MKVRVRALLHPRALALYQVVAASTISPFISLSLSPYLSISPNVYQVVAGGASGGKGGEEGVPS